MIYQQTTANGSLEQNIRLIITHLCHYVKLYHSLYFRKENICQRRIIRWFLLDMTARPRSYRTMMASISQIDRSDVYQGRLRRLSKQVVERHAPHVPTDQNRPWRQISSQIGLISAKRRFGVDACKQSSDAPHVQEHQHRNEGSGGCQRPNVLLMTSSLSSSVQCMMLRDFSGDLKLQYFLSIVWMTVNLKKNLTNPNTNMCHATLCTYSREDLLIDVCYS